MFSVQGIAVPESRISCTLPVVRLVPRPSHSQKYTPSPLPVAVEVVASVFGFAYHSSHDPISQSISLSHVCRQWRRISLSLPSLWTFIHLSLPLSENQLTRTCAWVIRSRTRPLDIYMDFRDPCWDWDETSHIFDYKAMESVMRLLLPQASRWRSIELLTDTWAPIYTFLTFTATIDSAPLLQTIRVARCNEYFCAPGETFRPADLARPVAWFLGGTSLRHLRHVSLSGVHLDWTQSGLAGLQALELRYHAQDVMPTLSEFRHILAANASLKRLVILGWGPRMDRGRASEEEDGDGEEAQQHATMTTVEMPLLAEFEFGFVDVTYATELLSLFALPRLRVLSVEDVASRIQPCARRQDCSPLLDRLVAMSAADSPDDVRPPPPRIPLSSLNELSLRSVYAENTALRGLFDRLCAVTSLYLDCVDATALLAACSALDACSQLRVVTLKDVDAAAAALVLSSHLFPPHLRIFLDIGDDTDENHDDGVDWDEEEHVASILR